MRATPVMGPLVSDERMTSRNGAMYSSGTTADQSVEIAGAPLSDAQALTSLQRQQTACHSPDCGLRGSRDTMSYLAI